MSALGTSCLRSLAEDGQLVGVWNVVQIGVNIIRYGNAAVPVCPRAPTVVQHGRQEGIPLVVPAVCLCLVVHARTTLAVEQFAAILPVVHQRRPVIGFLSLVVLVLKRQHPHVLPHGRSGATGKVQVHGTSHLGTALPYPTVALQHGRLHLHKVYACQVGRIALLVHRPLKVQFARGAVVGLIVGIPPGIGILHEIRSVSALVHGIRCKAHTSESQGLLPLQPLGPVVLPMVGIHCQIALSTLAVRPADVGIVRHGRVGNGSWRMPLRSHVVCHRIVSPCSRLAILASCQFIPLVVGYAVAIVVMAHKHQCRFARTALPCIPAIGMVGVAQYLQVIEPRTVLHHVVETEHHITAKGTQGHRSALAQQFLCLLADGFPGIALFVFGHSVQELPRSRTILVDTMYRSRRAARSCRLGIQAHGGGKHQCHRRHKQIVFSHN